MFPGELCADDAETDDMEAVECVHCPYPRFFRSYRAYWDHVRKEEHRITGRSTDVSSLVYGYYHTDAYWHYTPAVEMPSARTLSFEDHQITEFVVGLLAADAALWAERALDESQGRERV
jgi:hypothetical protein